VRLAAPVRHPRGGSKDCWAVDRELQQPTSPFEPGLSLAGCVARAQSGENNITQCLVLAGSLQIGAHRSFFRSFFEEQLAASAWDVLGAIQSEAEEQHSQALTRARVRAHSTRATISRSSLRRRHRESLNRRQRGAWAAQPRAFSWGPWQV
jgi:hypothetical protein